MKRKDPLPLEEVALAVKDAIENNEHVAARDSFVLNYYGIYRVLHAAAGSRRAKKRSAEKPTLATVSEIEAALDFLVEKGCTFKGQHGILHLVRDTTAGSTHYFVRKLQEGDK